jgi:hypothetical protein
MRLLVGPGVTALQHVDGLQLAPDDHRLLFGQEGHRPSDRGPDDFHETSCGHGAALRGQHALPSVMTSSAAFPITSQI